LNPTTDGGGNPGTNPNPGPPGAADGGSGGAFSCCLNEVSYVCPNKAATDKCAFGGFDIGGCMAACGPNPQCMADCQSKLAAAQPDPSQCTKQPGVKCKPSSPSNPSPICANVGSGKCTYDTECGSNEHCTDGSCYDNESGSKCQYDHQCGTGNHCTDGCCQDNDTGSTCQYDNQCGNGKHCTDGSCYPNAFGSPCQYDHQCASDESCVNGKCE
jgi:hypothetical protein